MLPTLSRRKLLGSLIGTGLALTISRDGAADERAGRKFTVDLVCGNIGVRARLPEAIALAHRYGFESVAPDAGYLKSLSENQLSELRADLTTKKLVWGAAGLAVDFRGTESSFQDGLRGLPDDAKALERAGVSRMGTWISPGHKSLTYLSNFNEQKDNTRDLPCATGVIDLKAFLGALCKIGYDGPVRAEPFKADLRRLSAEDAVERTAKAMKRAIELLT